MHLISAKYATKLFHQYSLNEAYPEPENLNIINYRYFRKLLQVPNAVRIYFFKKRKENVRNNVLMSQEHNISDQSLIETKR